MSSFGPPDRTAGSPALSFGFWEAGGRLNPQNKRFPARLLKITYFGTRGCRWHRPYLCVRGSVQIPCWPSSNKNRTVASRLGQSNAYALITLCYAIVLPGRKSCFWARLRLDSSRESLQIGLPSAGHRTEFEAFPFESGRKPARKPDSGPEALLHNIGGLFLAVFCFCFCLMRRIHAIHAPERP
jgi:hypothetical protein